MSASERPKAVVEAPGQTCALLTPLIKQEISKLASGDLLDVRSDDPSAREGVPAWSRLTGNELVDQTEDGESRTRFLIRKK